MKNIKLPHRLLLIYYGLQNEYAGKYTEVRRALSEAVLHEALFSEVIKIEKDKIVNTDLKSGGHSVLDDVSEAVAGKEGKRNFEFWKKELSKNDNIVNHVTDNLIENNLLEIKSKGGILSKKKKVFIISDTKLHLRIIEYLTANVSNNNYDQRDYLTIDLLKRHDIPGLDKVQFEIFSTDIEKPFK
mgnify:CR=1 FL=1